MSVVGKLSFVAARRAQWQSMKQDDKNKVVGIAAGGVIGLLLGVRACYDQGKTTGKVNAADYVFNSAMGPLVGMLGGIFCTELFGPYVVVVGIGSTAVVGTGYAAMKYGASKHVPKLTDKN